jgi:hypothetical protein
MMRLLSVSSLDTEDLTTHRQETISSGLLLSLFVRSSAYPPSRGQLLSS